MTNAWDAWAASSKCSWRSLMAARRKNKQSVLRPEYKSHDFEIILNPFATIAWAELQDFEDIAGLDPCDIMESNNRDST